MTVSIFLFEFEIKKGPIIVNSITNMDFSEDQINVLRQNSFPESAISNLKTNHMFFTFTLHDPMLFCFSLYVKSYDPSLPRFHQQNTFILVTDLPYYTPFFHFLMSSIPLIENSPKNAINKSSPSKEETLHLIDILNLFGDFSKKWINQLKQTTTKFDLPSFVSSIPISKPKNQTDFFEEIPVYFINNMFLDIDLCSALGVHYLVKQGQSKDILRLWELSLLSEKLNVFGANANYSSNAALAIYSLSYPIKNECSLFPFISLTDSRVSKIIQNNYDKIIVGISNPVLIDNLNFENVFDIGFSDITEQGMTSKIWSYIIPQSASHQYIDGIRFSNYGKWDFFADNKVITSKMIRLRLYKNTIKLIQVIKKVFYESCNMNPYDSLNGIIDKRILASYLYESDVEIASNYDTFAQRLIERGVFQRVCHKICKTDNQFEIILRNFPISQFCANLNEAEKIDLYSKIDSLKKNFIGHENVLKLFDDHLLAIKLLISPDLQHCNLNIYK